MSIPTPEQAFTKKILQYEEPLSDAEFEIEQTLVKKMREYKPKFEDFEDIYSESELKQDRMKLEEQRLEEKEAHQRALILEAILGHHIEQSNWFGPNCSVAFASEYDDRFHNTDLVLEFNQDDKVIRLAVDITTAETPEVLEKKRIKIKKDIEKGALTNLKYFISEAEPEKKGKLFGLPRVIIAATGQGVEFLSEMIIKKDAKALAKTSVQVALLKEVIIQLEKEIEYSQLYFGKFDKQRKPVITEHKEILRVINAVLEDKKKLLGFNPEAELFTKEQTKHLLGNWDNDIEMAAKARTTLKGYNITLDF